MLLLLLSNKTNIPTYYIILQKYVHGNVFCVTKFEPANPKTYTTILLAKTHTWRLANLPLTYTLTKNMHPSNSNHTQLLNTNTTILCFASCALKLIKKGPHISPDIINAQYTVETLVMAVLAGSIFSLLVGFFTGYFCGRRCHKDEDDNLPYPDTEYEYFEQRQNVNR